MTHTPHRPFLSALSALVPSALVLAAMAAWPPSAAAQAAPAAQAATTDRQDFSAAERLLFMTDQLSKLKTPASLRYRYAHGGTLDEGFEDTVTINVKRPAGAECCSTSGEFLTGARKLTLPDIDEARSNPVLLFFLEHDVREMQRITRGSQSYYRKRIRMAAYDSATITDLSLPYQGKGVPVKRIELRPYDNDPARSRFEKYARKSYQFYLSDAVPGGIYGLRTVMAADTPGDGPMNVDQLFIEGANPPAEVAAVTLSPAKTTAPAAAKP